MTTSLPVNGIVFTGPSVQITDAKRQTARLAESPIFKLVAHRHNPQYASVPYTPKNVQEYLASGCGRCELGNTPQCKVVPWTNELDLLVGILRNTDLREQLKWSAPCYTYQGKNILMLSALKEKVVISFFRGAELDDDANLLIQPGDHTRFAKYLQFTNAQTIIDRKADILRYIQAAIELEQSSQGPTKRANAALPYPEELETSFRNDQELKDAFNSLTPGRQRGYLIHFSSAKQSKTKMNRIQKCRAKILAGKGWNEF